MTIVKLIDLNGWMSRKTKKLISLTRKLTKMRSVKIKVSSRINSKLLILFKTINKSIVNKRKRLKTFVNSNQNKMTTISTKNKNKKKKKKIGHSVISTNWYQILEETKVSTPTLISFMRRINQTKTEMKRLKN